MKKSMLTTCARPIPRGSWLRRSLQPSKPNPLNPQQMVCVCLPVKPISKSVIDNLLPLSKRSNPQKSGSYGKVIS